MRIKILSISLVAGVLFVAATPASAQFGNVATLISLLDPTPITTDTTVVSGTTETTVSVGSTDVTVTSDASTAPVVDSVTTIIDPNDTIAPRITDVLDVSLYPTEATIAWTTDELADSRLEYGPTLNYGSQAALGISLALVHSATLLGLTPATTYYYCVHSKDAAGNEASDCGHTFTTATDSIVVEIHPPIISTITISGVTSTSAKITWSTDEIADSQVEYGITDAYGLFTPIDLTLDMFHSAVLSNLLPNTQYHFRVKSSDHAGHEVISGDGNFTTAALITASDTSTDSTTSTDTTGPVVSAIAASTVTATGATVTWKTNEPTDSRIEYGESMAYGNITMLDSSLDLSHSHSLTELSSYTHYHYRVRSRDASGNVTFSEDHEFTTLAVPLMLDTAPVISNVAVTSVSKNSATITWTTNDAANSQMEYGLSSAYGDITEINPVYATSHQETITGLSPNTIYHFRVRSKDVVGNFSFSEDLMFKTEPVLDALPPQAVGDLTVLNMAQTSVTLSWTVPVDASGILHYDIRHSTNPLTADNFDDVDSVHDAVLYADHVEESGINHEYTVVGLTPGTKYYFALQAVDPNNHVSPISNVASGTTRSAQVVGGATRVTAPASNSGVGSTGSISGTPSGDTADEANFTSSNGTHYRINDTTAPGQPRNLKAQPLDSQIAFFWTNPNDADFLRVRILRKTDSYPNSYTDGTIIYEGDAETFSDGRAVLTDTGLANGKTYYYSFYAYDRVPNFSAPVRLSAAPQAGKRQTGFVVIPAFLSATPSFTLTKNLSFGVKTHEVEHVQALLATDSTLYPAGLINGYYGPLLKQTITKLQARYGLVQNGKIDAATRVKILELSKLHQIVETPLEAKTFVLTRDLYRNTTGEDVRYLQKFLRDRGFYPEGLTTGVFDHQLEHAVMRFKKQYGIEPVSGYAGIHVRRKIQELIGR